MTENSKKVMIIEDNEDIVTMIKVMLEMKGYNVFLKMNIINLENSIKQVSPDLIIMDMLLSGADGRDICKSFKNNKKFATIPVLMISAHPNAKEECLDAGADMFLEKPFDVRDFFDTVEKSLLLNT
jgi:DNA-binding response OmpR family regulator